MKLIATVTDAGGVVHAGASIEARSGIIEIPDDSLPNIVKEYLKSIQWAKEGPNRHNYLYLTFSILEETTNAT